MTVEEYKNEIINFYVEPIDETFERLFERRRIFEKRYSEEFISKVISDTYKFIELLEKECETYYRVKVSEEAKSYISLGLFGGRPSDILYHDCFGNIISRKILNRYYKNEVMIEIIDDEYTNEDEINEDISIVSYSYDSYIYVQRSMKNILSKKLK